MNLLLELFQGSKKARKGLQGSTWNPLESAGTLRGALFLIAFAFKRLGNSQFWEFWDGNGKHWGEILGWRSLSWG